MASSSAATGEGAVPPEPVPVAVGTKRPREEARETGIALASGLEAWAAQAAPTPGRTADVPLVEQQSAHLEERAHARSAGGASTSQPVAATPPTGTHLSLGASPRPSKRKTRCFRYGNYHRYYGYRVGETLEDHRVAHFRDEWFAGKRVLDVGCNEGLVGLSIAVRCKPAKMLGVDIDPHLVKKAREKLARLKRAAERLARERKEDERMTEKEDGTKSNASVEAGVASVANDTPHDPIADDARPQSENENENENTHEDALADAAEALNAVSFSRCDVTAPDEDERNKGLFARESLDAVLCLSVTKWIQLNWGDAGLKRLFMDVHESLTPGGVFIVEPQPWRSYRQAFRKQHMPEETKAHFRAIALRPSLYAEFLRTAVGFERVTTLRDADMHDASEFDRTVLLCVKKSADVGG